MRNFIFLSQSLTINEKKKLTARERPVNAATFIKGRGEGVSVVSGGGDCGGALSKGYRPARPQWGGVSTLRRDARSFDWITYRISQSNVDA